MAVYIFMLGWVVIWGIMSQMTAQEVCVGNEAYEKRANLFMTIVTFSVIILFAGLRSGVADTYSYINMFKEYPLWPDAYEFITDPEAREPGFRVFSVLIKTFISQDYQLWLFIIASISGICIMYPLYKYSCNYGMSVFLFMASCQFTWLLNGMRQFLVASILFACTHLILNKNPIPYIIIVLILSTFHKSALIMIPAYFIVSSEPWSKRTMIFVGVVVLAMLFTSQFTSILDTVVENSDYATSMEEFKNTDDGTNLIRIMVELAPIVMALLYRNKIKDKLTPIIKVSINMSLISSGLYIISRIARSGIMLGRLPIYFSLYNMILLPWLIKNIFEKKERRLVNYGMIICYLGFFYYQMCIAWGGLEYVSDILNLYY
ncbi:EpsG family protein [Terrisporobacter petrolearius]|uniref:EpsG family protein n=1 Tax=Terrisporobacter petrolearius TaxID=1460447 RepID=UPI001D16EEFD|nr:EpsG family protein [Terrisporobacter petrolearius]MCC3865801.1 EpsG family protein [Terrisporobacter petrolearius]